MSRDLRGLWLGGTLGLTVGAFALAMALAPDAGQAPGPALRWLIFIGSSTHVGATAWFYTDREVRGHMSTRPGRYFIAPVALVLGTALVVSVLPLERLTVPLMLFFAWQFFHFQKQNLGMAALAASAHGAGPLRQVERAAITAAGVAGIVGILAHPALLALPEVIDLRVLFPVAGAAFVGAAVIGLVAVARRESRPWQFLAVYAAAVLFFLPVFVFSSPFLALTGLILAHGYQYLVIVALVARARLVSLAMLLNVALLVGVLLHIAASYRGATFPGSLIFGAYLGLTMAHFVIDAGLWRLRDEFPRAFLGERLPFLLRR
ncbi:hypothetical protein [Alloactinosynnema sp. L-07]|uniref:hypothetical protein n=1 Tax=Alloactinosynnema sp. L-07 TaxID=1653480 RepID=UPI00065F0B20|nr:hypothetical protein [Alloactinosynnema sp. L-07]CRK61119.1 hypothetical protein [Alloactinosynnema sp. L-07]